MSSTRRAVRPSSGSWVDPRPDPRGKSRKKPIQHEENEQKALILWAHWQPVPPAPDIEPAAKLADYLFAIPNGGARNKKTAADLRAAGVKAGVWDLMLPIARQGFNGLWVEMKYGKNNLSSDQRDWGARMRLAGYQTAVAWSQDDAKAAICRYLGIRQQGGTINAT